MPIFIVFRCLRDALHNPLHLVDFTALRISGMIDIGANLTHESFRDDLPEVLAAARQHGLEHIVLTGTSVGASQAAVALAGEHPDMLSATAGIHPHEADTCDEKALQALADLAGSPQLRAMGETGLDFNRDYSPRDAQERAFEAQLEVAVSTGLPLFLHQRDAHERFMALLRPYLPCLSRVVVHCFTGVEQELREYLDHDLYIGITGWVCDERRGGHLHPLLPLIPDNRLMLETDSPYLLPRTIRPKPRSRRNEPANLPWVCETVAACLDRSAAEVARLTAENARRFFALEAGSS